MKEQNQDFTEPQRDQSDPTFRTPQLTFGQKLVGLNFNPSNDDKVSKAKQLCADLADLLFNDDAQSERSSMKDLLLPHAYASILDAQMNVVKVLTLKY